MFIRLQGNIFKSAVNDLMIGGIARINFLLREDKILALQTFGSVVTDLYIKDLILANPVTNDTEGITVTLDNSINLIDSKEDVYINVRGDIMEIRQDNFQYNASREPERRVDSAIERLKMTQKCDPISLSNYINSTKYLDDVARSLSKSTEDITIKNSNAYMKYSNTVYAAKVSLPDLCIPGEVARKLSTSLTGAETTDMQEDKERSLIYFKVNSNKVVTVAVGQPNHKLAEDVEELIGNMKSIAKIDMSKYKDSIDTICKTYKKDITIDFSICKDNSLLLFVQTPKTQFTVGNSTEIICTIKISVAQLSAIAKLFGTLNTVDILRGDNNICLAQQILGKKLIVAGILF